MSSKLGKAHQKSVNGSVDSNTATTTAPIDSGAIECSASVQSAGFLLPDSLSLGMERFVRTAHNVGHDARIRRSVCNMLQRLHTNATPVSLPASSISNTRIKKQSQVRKLEIPSNLRVIGKPLKRSVPPASVLRPPRGCLVCPMRDLSRELLAIRRLPRSERFSAGARFIRTLDTSCPSHNDIAQSIYLICTL